MDNQLWKLICEAIDQTITPEGFEQLQDAIEQSDEARNAYLNALNLSESLREIVTDDAGGVAAVVPSESSSGIANTGFQVSVGHFAIAATVLFLVSGAAFWFGRHNGARGSALGPTAGKVDSAAESSTTESLIAGHATLRRTVELAWSSDSTTYREGDVLPDGLIGFHAGVAEIDLFCGATLIVEGPARLDLESDWSVRVLEGRLRASVPPAARGFVVKAADSEIIDLGTEFALEVSSGRARVEVLDGEVELRGGKHDGSHLVTGQRKWLKGASAQPEAFEGLSTVTDVQRRRQDAARQRLNQWKEDSRQLRSDSRLIAYYPIAESSSGRSVPNAAVTGSGLDGRLVGLVNRAAGRFGLEAPGLEFDRPGARVRVRIDGEFSSYTFAAWVKIDSLEHRYNAIFMGDGYDNGEPHWQIRDDGRLMFSVMVDDTKPTRRFDETEQRVVTTAGLHHIYYTEPIWKVAMSGQWFHVAAVYDPQGRRVVQYVNGKQVSSEEIVDEYYTETLHIGPAEIGNWGQPVRESPWFAVRNLNGTIDELAIFHAPLTAKDIQSLYAKGKPLGY